MDKATQQDTKEHNTQLILKMIYQNDAVSRAELARLTNLTRTTVSNIVSELLQTHLITELGHGPSKGGKRPILLGFNQHSYDIIALDLSNRFFRGALLDLRGEILYSLRVTVNNATGDKALDLVCQLIDSLQGQASRPILGIGIGVPGITNAQAGIVDEALNLGWEALPMKKILEERFSLNVHIANDSQLAALGEFNFGAEQKQKNFIVIKAGQGISAGIVINGRLYQGDSSGHGEIGHIKVVDNELLCHCGHMGCLETVASSRAIIAQARDLFSQDDRSLLHNLAPTAEEIDTDTILNAVQAGDSPTAAIITNAGKHIGIAISFLIGILNIHHIVIGGRLARFGSTLLNPIQNIVNSRVLTRLVDKTHITLSTLEEDGVLKGAAAIVLANDLSVV